MSQHVPAKRVPHLTMERKIGKIFYKRLRLPNGRSECVITRFELDEATGQLVEHITMQTHGARFHGGPRHVARGTRRTALRSRRSWEHKTFF